jgi:formate dehydrogenase subunit gamma
VAYGGNIQAVLAAQLVGNICFDMFVIMIPVHIYLGAIINPGALRIMITGKVPLDWAKSHHGKWVKKMGFE